MSGYSKKRLSLGGFAVGLAAAALLVISIGAGTGTAAVAAAPTNTALPKITGTPRVGRTLTTDDGKWANAPTSFAYMWLRCKRDGNACSTIPSAAAKTYVLVAADEKQTIRVRVTATNADGSTPAESKQTGAVGAAPGGGGAAPANTSLPTITGLAKVGQTLAAGNGKWSGKPTGFSYAWQRCSADAKSCANIAGASGKNYIVTVASVGFRLRVTVTAKNAKGSTSANSAVTAVVAPLVTIKNKRPTIAILSARFTGRVVYVRFRICDDSRKNVTILATDSRPGVASYTRRFTTLIAPKPCGVYSRHWTPVARFQGHGKYTVTLRARDKSGLTSLAAHRTFTR
jgi:hypothetical protein